MQKICKTFFNIGTEKSRNAQPRNNMCPVDNLPSSKTHNTSMMKSAKKIINPKLEEKIMHLNYDGYTFEQNYDLMHHEMNEAIELDDKAKMR